MANNPYTSQRLAAERNVNHIKQEMKSASDFSKPIKESRLNIAQGTLTHLKDEEKAWNNKHK